MAFTTGARFSSNHRRPLLPDLHEIGGPGVESDRALTCLAFGLFFTFGSKRIGTLPFVQ